MVRPNLLSRLLALLCLTYQPSALLAEFDFQPYCHKLPAQSRVEDLRGIPKLTVELYPVSGKDLAAAKADMRQRGPRDHLGYSFDAYTSWHIKWSWPTSGNKARLADVVADYSVKVQLPDWQEMSRAPAVQQKKWKEFIAQLIAHEYGHVMNVTQSYQSIPEAIRRANARGQISTAAEANALANQLLNKIRQSDVEYDRCSEHGKRQGVRLSVN